jgi:hypothetical protein
MGIIQAILCVNEFAENEFTFYEPDEGSDPQYIEDADVAIETVKTWLSEYKQLEPDWSSPKIPEWAQYVTVDASGDMFAFAHDIQVHNAIWDANQVAPKFLSRIQIPLGIDWRLLKWERPHA